MKIRDFWQTENIALGSGSILHERHKRATEIETAMWSFGSSVGVWEFLEYTFEVLVIVGCAGEAAGEFTNVWNIRSAPDKKDRLLKISTIILLVGLAGALISTVRTNVLAGEMISALDSKAKHAIADADKAFINSAEAKRESNSAIHSASDAAKTSKGANVQANSALREATEAQRELLGARIEAAKADGRALAAQKALDEYRAPRTLTIGQKAVFLSQLQHTAEQQFAVYVTPEPEPRQFLDSLAGVLQSLGWKVSEGVESDLRLGKAGIRVAQGVVVQGTPDRVANTLDVTHRLVNALRGAGIAARLEPDPKLEATPNIINIIVGTKQ